jgi:hypothetical protein
VRRAMRGEVMAGVPAVVLGQSLQEQAAPHLS